MSLKIFDMPAEPNDLRLWLERQLVGEQLGALVAELKAIHGIPVVDLVLKDVLKSDITDGLAGIEPRELEGLLSHPQLLLELQEMIFEGGSEYWMSLHSSDQSDVGREWLRLLGRLTGRTYNLDRLQPAEIQKPPLPAGGRVASLVADILEKLARIIETVTSQTDVLKRQHAIGDLEGWILLTLAGARSSALSFRMIDSGFEDQAVESALNQLQSRGLISEGSRGVFGRRASPLDEKVLTARGTEIVAVLLQDRFGRLREQLLLCSQAELNAIYDALSKIDQFLHPTMYPSDWVAQR